MTMSNMTNYALMSHGHLSSLVVTFRHCVETLLCFYRPKGEKRPTTTKNATCTIHHILRLLLFQLPSWSLLHLGRCFLWFACLCYLQKALSLQVRRREHQTGSDLTRSSRHAHLLDEKLPLLIQITS